jgi:hypothetical protein
MDEARVLARAEKDALLLNKDRNARELFHEERDAILSDKSDLVSHGVIELNLLVRADPDAAPGNLGSMVTAATKHPGKELLDMFAAGCAVDAPFKLRDWNKKDGGSPEVL